MRTGQNSRRESKQLGRVVEAHKNDKQKKRPPKSLGNSNNFQCVGQNSLRTEGRGVVQEILGRVNPEIPTVRTSDIKHR